MGEFSSTLISFDTKIGVLCGGLSSEREVSLRSGKNCFTALQRLGYINVELIDVDRNIANVLIDKNIEIAYIALHGAYGEDGCIQGLLELLGIKYTGSGVKASSIAMDKEFTKRILKTQNIPIIPSVLFTSIEQVNAQKGTLNYPLMIKPVAEGSSIGMSKVNSSGELESAVSEAFKYNSVVMAEEYVNGTSLTVGVLDTKEKTFATPILEFRTKTEWYDYEAKYTEGLTEFILPAQISQELTEKVKELSILSHKALDCKGVSRVDFIIDKNNKPYVLEVNTIPGMTDLSDLPAQAKCMGIEYDELVNILLNSAIL